MQLAACLDPPDEGRHPLGAPRDMRPQDGPHFRTECLVLLQHVRRAGQQLLVARVLEGRLAHPARHHRLRFRRGAIEQPDELRERLLAQRRGPEDSILEGVDDAEKQIGDSDLVAGRLRQAWDRERERPARLL
jgi:hypothetical protein